MDGYQYLLLHYQLSFFYIWLKGKLSINNKHFKGSCELHRKQCPKRFLLEDKQLNLKLPKCHKFKLICHKFKQNSMFTEGQKDFCWTSRPASSLLKWFWANMTQRRILLECSSSFKFKYVLEQNWFDHKDQEHRPYSWN